VVRLLLLAIWLSIVVGVVAALIVVGLLFAPNPPTDLDQPVNDDGLPDDYIPRFVPPRRRCPPLRALPLPRRIIVVPAPTSVMSTTPRPAEANELGQVPTICWPSRFPGA
jgi:hypothetical protein